MEFLNIDSNIVAPLRRMRDEITRFEQARTTVERELAGASFPGRSENGNAEARVDARGRLLGVTIDQHTLRRGRADLIGPDLVAAVDDARERMLAESYRLIAVRLAETGGLS